MKTNSTSSHLSCSSVSGGSSGVRGLMISVANSWLSTFDQAFYSAHPRHNIDSTVNHLFDIICCLIENLKCVPQELFVPIVLYADKFVRIHGIKHNQLFNLLLSSLMVSVKFWSESAVVSNRRIATLFQYSLPDLNVMERRFLMGIDYKLPITKESINEFLLYAVQTQQTLGVISSPSSVTTTDSQSDFISSQKRVARKRLAESMSETRKIGRCVKVTVDDDNTTPVADFIQSRECRVEPILISH